MHIEPSSIEALQPVPYYDRHMSHMQLTSERVRVTLYGCDNDMASDFLDLVISYSRDTDVIGMMNPMPAIRDDKRPWPEGMVIAQKKVIDFHVSYVQRRINDLARQMILQAQATVVTTAGVAFASGGEAGFAADAVVVQTSVSGLAGEAIVVADGVIA